MNDNEIVPFSEIETSPIDLNLAVKQGQKMVDTLKKMGIKEATFDSGAEYSHDEKTNITTIAADGILMQQSEHTTTVIFRNKDSSKGEALVEISDRGPTQKILGAFSDNSQQRVSQILLDSDTE